MSLLDGLVSHWRLDEASGARVDIHGGHDALENGAVASTAGKLGDAALFDGSSFLSPAALTPDLDGAGPKDFTIAAWLRRTGLGSSLFATRAASDGEVPYYLYSFDDTPPLIGLTFGVAGAGAEYPEVIVHDFSPLDEWIFCVGWFEYGVGLSLQLNNGAPGFTAYPQDNYALADGTPIRFGEALTGALDSLSFWNRALTADERTALYNAGAGLDYPFASQKKVLVVRAH